LPTATPIGTYEIERHPIGHRNSLLGEDDCSNPRAAVHRAIRRRTNRRLRRSAAERRPPRAVDVVVVTGDRFSNQLADRALGLGIGCDASLFDD
jgi:hypothetical protein